MVGLSVGKKHFIQGGIAQGIRTDGRKRLTYRPISVQTGNIPQANGSARVKMRDTDVIASSRGGEELSAELSAALQRSLLGGKSGADGNLLDALGAAIKAALSNTGIPRVTVADEASSDEKPEVDVSDEDFLQFDTSKVPVIVTLTKVSKHYIVDVTSQEESDMSSAVSVSVNRQGRICGLTKRDGAGLDPSVILDMISIAKRVSEQLIKKLDSEISAAEACKEES